MNEPRKHKPLWRWEALLFALVLLFAIVAGVLPRTQEFGVVTVVSLVLLVLAIALAVLLVLPLLRRTGRDSENTRTTIEGVDLVPLPEGSTFRVEESRTRQGAIEAALAKSRALPTAVLTPDASRWLGRELRVAVELVSDDGVVHRAGFLPRAVGAPLDAELLALAERGAAATVGVVVRGDARPYTVDVLLGSPSLS